jgi:hypothetical protein
LAAQGNYTDAVKFGNAQTLWENVGVALANNKDWPNQPSGYFNKGADYSWENLSIARLATLAKAWNATGWCNNGFINAAGQEVPAPAACGGSAANNLPEYNPLGAAFAAKQGELEDIYGYYLQKDKTKLIITIAIILFILIIALTAVTL